MCTARLTILNDFANTGFLISSYRLRKKVTCVPNYILDIYLDRLGDLYWMTDKYATDNSSNFYILENKMTCIL